MSKAKIKIITEAAIKELQNPSDTKVHPRSPEHIARQWISRAAKETSALNILLERTEGKVATPIGQAPDLPPLQLVVTGVPRLEPTTIDVTPNGESDNPQLGQDSNTSLPRAGKAGKLRLSRAIKEIGEGPRTNSEGAPEHIQPNASSPGAHSDRSVTSATG